MMAYQHLAGIQGSPLIANLGHQDIARQYYEKARGLFEEAYAADPELVKEYYAGFLLRCAALDVPPDRLAESLAMLRQAAALFEALSAADPEARTYKRDRVEAYDYMGRRLLAMGKFEDALFEFGRSLTLAESIRRRHPGDRAVLHELLTAENGIVRTLMLSGDRAGSLEHARTLLARAKEGVLDGTDRALRQSYVAEAYTTMASVHQAFHEWADSRDAARQAISLLRPLVTGRTRDPNAKMLREAEQLVAECEANLTASR